MVGYYDDNMAIIIDGGALGLCNHVNGLNRPLFLSQYLQLCLDYVHINIYYTDITN